MRFLILLSSFLFLSCGVLFDSSENNVCDQNFDMVTKYFCEEEYLKSFLASDFLKIDIIAEPNDRAYKYFKNSSLDIARRICLDPEGIEYVEHEEEYYEFCNDYITDQDSEKYNFKLLDLVSEGYWGTVREKYWSMHILKDINYLPLLLEYGYYLDSINDVLIFIINDDTLFSIERGVDPDLVFEHLGIKKKELLKTTLRDHLIKPLVQEDRLSEAFMILYLTEGRDYALPKAIFDYENDKIIDFRIFDAEKCELFKSREYLLKSILERNKDQCWKDTSDYFNNENLQIKERYRLEKELGLKKNFINYHVSIFELENKVTSFYINELIKIGSIDKSFYNLIFDNYIIICEKKEMCDYTKQVIDVKGDSA